MQQEQHERVDAKAMRMAPLVTLSSLNLPLAGTGLDLCECKSHSGVSSRLDHTSWHDPLGVPCQAIRCLADY